MSTGVQAVNKVHNKNNIRSKHVIQSVEQHPSLVIWILMTVVAGVSKETDWGFTPFADKLIVWSDNQIA